MSLNIAILSGKGGTGKTTVSTSLTKLLKSNYVDCDVEEPNGFIFFKPKVVKSQDVTVEYPVIDSSKCTICGECAKVCQFNALCKSKNGIMVFEKLCHSCGACSIVCKNKALTYKERVIGIVEEGFSKDISCMRGVLNVGEPMAVPVIKKLLGNLKTGLNILDCSPGTSCNVITTLLKSDAAVLVTEPSAFGLHDLALSVKLLRKLDIPFGVVVNKYSNQDDTILSYCKSEDINIFGVIPFSREGAVNYSKGNMLLDSDEFKHCFNEIAQNMRGVFLWN